MSTAENGSMVRLETAGDMADVADNVLDALIVNTFDVVPPFDDGPHRSVSIRSIHSSELSVGNVITLKVARRTGFTGNHGGIFKLISITMTIGQVTDPEGTDNGSVSDTSASTQGHLATGVYNFISGTVSADTEAPTVGSDFQAWDALTSTSAGARVDVSYEGRLTSEQSTITLIKIPIKGTGEYNLKIYAEGASNPVYTTGLSPVSASRNVLNIPSASLSEQPIGEGRYFVIIEATIDSGENIRVGLPYVRQD
jgi:hypothetical protein